MQASSRESHALKNTFHYNSEKWGPRHHLIVALHATGLKNTEIAERLNLHPGTVSQVLGDPRAKVELSRVLERVLRQTTDVRVKMHLAAPAAIDVIIDQIHTSPDEKVRQKAAFGLLDRAGYSPVQKHVVQRAPTLDPSVQSRMLEALSDEEIVDADYSIYEEPSEADFDTFSDPSDENSTTEKAPSSTPDEGS